MSEPTPVVHGKAESEKAKSENGAAATALPRGRSGFLTSTFWMVLAALALVLVLALKDKLDANLAGLLIIALPAFYAQVRKERALGHAELNADLLAGALAAAGESVIEARYPEVVAMLATADANSQAREKAIAAAAAATRSLSPCLLVSLLAFGGCTTLYERGQKVAVFGSNFAALEYQSAGGSTLKAARLDNAIIIRSAGTAVAAGAIGLGTAAATGGLTRGLAR